MALGLWRRTSTTTRRNCFSNPATDLGDASYVVATENRMTANLTTIGTGTGTFIPDGSALPLANISP
jgi:hypothetical protein